MKNIDMFQKENQANFTHYVMYKNKKLAKIKMEDVSEDILVTIVQDLELPLFLIENLEAIINNRTPPKGRYYMDDLLNSIGLSEDDPISIIDYSYGLSLIDCLWFPRKDVNFNEINWGTVNLYNNKFNEMISELAFSGGHKEVLGTQLTPELPTTGNLPKKWTYDSNNNIILMKGSTEKVFGKNAQEPFSEVIASQLLKILGYDFIDYYLGERNGRIVSYCNIYTNESQSLVHVKDKIDINNGMLGVIRLYKDLGYYEDLLKILTLDYLILNPDRHLSNFGFLVDSESYDIIKPFPIYDNGNSLLAYYNKNNSLEEYINVLLPPKMYDTYDTILDLLDEEDLSTVKRMNVQRLKNFKIDRSELLRYKGDICITNEKLDLIEEVINKQVNKFIEYFKI